MGTNFFINSDCFALGENFSDDIITSFENDILVGEYSGFDYLLTKDDFRYHAYLYKSPSFAYKYSNRIWGLF